MITLNNTTAVERYISHLEDEVAFGLDHIMSGLGLIGRQNLEYLMVDRLIRIYGMSPDFALSVAARGTCVFN
jgi:hypothetical protein